MQTFQPSKTGARGRDEPDSEIVLLCNPQAGGRWTDLAPVLDSDEGKHVRRIVTDSVHDIAPAITELGQDARLLCVYGGDGTIARILDRLSPTKHGSDWEPINLALIGGGTMNVTSRWCGFGRRPADNFREVVRAYRAGQLLFRETALLEVEQAATRHRGFTFGIGPIVRLLDAYERGPKGKIAALATAGRGIAAALTGFPSGHAKLLDPLQARVIVDGEELPFAAYSAVFANVTGQINPGVTPFVDRGTRDTFHYAAYAVSAREFTLNVPVLMRGWLPLDLRSLFRPRQIVRRLADTNPVKASVPADPLYINRNARRMEVLTDEELYTIDGEILRSDGGPLQISLGLQVRLAVSSRLTLGATAAKIATRLGWS